MPVLMRRMKDNPRYARQIFERDEQELNRLETEDKIKSEDVETFKELIERYQQMPILMRHMKNNPNFARAIFDWLDRDINGEK